MPHTAAILTKELINVQLHGLSKFQELREIHTALATFGLRHKALRLAKQLGELNLR